MPSTLKPALVVVLPLVAFNAIGVGCSMLVDQDVNEAARSGGHSARPGHIVDHAYPHERFELLSLRWIGLDRLVGDFRSVADGSVRNSVLIVERRPGRSLGEVCSGAEPGAIYEIPLQQVKRGPVWSTEMLNLDSLVCRGIGTVQARANSAETSAIFPLDNTGPIE